MLGESFVPFSKILCLKLCLVPTNSDPAKSPLVHHRGTLWDMEEICANLSEEWPLINPLIKSKKEEPIHPLPIWKLSIARVAQSRLPSNYETVFKVPDLRGHLDWTIIGTRGTISPLHMDGEGMGTVIVILKGNKYWIFGTLNGKCHVIYSVDSLGPNWNPYAVNEGDNIACFCFKAVHLQKGDMLYVLFLLNSNKLLIRFEVLCQGVCLIWYWAHQTPSVLGDTFTAHPLFGLWLLVLYIHFS